MEPSCMISQKKMMDKEAGRTRDTKRTTVADRNTP